MIEFEEVRMSVSEWVAEFDPTLAEKEDVPKGLENYIRLNWTETLGTVESGGPMHVWSVIRSGDCAVHLVNGYRIKDVIGYITTTKPFKAETNYKIA